MIATWLPTDAERFPRLVGRQDPEILAHELGDTTESDKALKLFERIRKYLMPWQRLIVTLMFMLGPDGLWVHPDVVLVVPRQNGKSLILVLRVIYGLFVRKEKILYTTQKWATGYDTYQRLQGIVNAVPAWRRQIDKDNLSQGKGYMLLKNGAQVTFATRGPDTGRGMDAVDLVIFDEAYNLTAAHVSSILPIQLAALNPQTIYASSAVNAREHPNGEVLAGLRRAGIAQDPGQLYAEFCSPVEGNLERTDPQAAIEANPSFGVIQTLAKIKKALRVATTPEALTGFDAEYLGRGDWPGEGELDEEIEHVINLEHFGGLVRSRRGFGKQRVMAIDMAPSGGGVDIACAARTLDSKIHVEIGYHAAPTPGLIRVVLMLLDRMQPDLLIIDKLSPAYLALVPELTALGLEPYISTAEDMAAACGGFYTAAMDSSLSHTGDPLILDGLESATKRDMLGGQWAWNRKGAALISPLVAVTLAHWGMTRLIIDGTKAKPTQQIPDPDSYVEQDAESSATDILMAAF
jgi:hypothetical protein